MKLCLALFCIIYFPITLAQNPCPGMPTILYEGKTYNTVQIGTQCWFKENLDVGKLISGSKEQSNNNIIEKYCYDNNASNCTKYGALYQWYEAMQHLSSNNKKGICPSGWHIPTRKEYDTFLDYLNDQKILISETGFQILLAGSRSFGDGGFDDVGIRTDFWISDAKVGSFAPEFCLVKDRDPYISGSLKTYGFSVRCLKD